MTCGSLRLPPEEGGQVRAVLDKLTDRVFKADTTLTHEQAAADALVGMVTSGDGAGVAVDVQMAVVVDLDVLRRGDAWPGERCEIPGVGPVNATWVRERYGDAFINLVVAHGRDVRCVARPGHRYITPHVRMALLVAGRECAIDGCGRRGYLERDHEIGIADHGQSRFDNMGWLCSHHHRKKTAGWTLGPPHPHTGKRHLTPPDPHQRE